MEPKELLLACLDEMRGSLQSRDALTIQNVAEETELTRTIADRDIAAVRLTNCSVVVKEILDALERFDNGEFGQCLECDEPISARRLQALPWARRCIRCQEAHDHGGFDQIAA